MKGRRRARELALQALYEIDLSDHPVDAVVAGRLADLYETGVRAEVVPEEWPAALALARMLAQPVATDGGGRGFDGAAAARTLRREPDWVDAVVAALAPLRKQAEYAVRLIHGVVGQRSRLDQAIRQIAPEWPVEQMAPVDRNVLRIALWELTGGEVPLRVAINEAVELARRYSGEGARRMVNGALGAFASMNPRPGVAALRRHAE